MICLKNVSVFFENAPLLKQINLELKAPFKVGIVGESGSGKSTLAKLLCGLLGKNLKIEGLAHAFGFDLFKSSEKQLRALRKETMKYIVQEPYYALNPYLSIGFQLKEANPTIFKNNQIYSLLQAYDFFDPKVLKAYPHQLSGGQRQRLSLVMALISKPKVLVADEPTTALDPILQKAILQNIQSFISQEDASLILISHDLEMIQKNVDLIFVMHEGKIIESIESKNLFDFPKDPYTIKLTQIFKTNPFLENLHG